MTTITDRPAVLTCPDWCTAPAGHGADHSADEMTVTATGDHPDRHRDQDGVARMPTVTVRRNRNTDTGRDVVTITVWRETGPVECITLPDLLPEEAEALARALLTANAEG